VSTIGPVAVGVVLAFAWNMTMSQPQGDTEADSVTPAVGLTVEQAAAQAWASATPRAATAQIVNAGTQAGGTAAAGTSAATSPAVPVSGPWYALHPRTPGRPAGNSCPWVRPSRTPDRRLQVRVVSVCTPELRGPRQAVHPVRRIGEG